ncbi:MAG TPA: acyl-CoA dehydrogenase [Gammaproteobacteria bacterium]|jgi:alkylation response protein AidB-like acyl-CoA dehydrogenase|nr:acyl-CoA dehydrogenase [Gammaproteobacteria bacterium]MDA0826365.1 acyl-CoA dehydrogenase family protein [Pseudomonadota bacterium]MDA7591398.1 acyl-CoA dehydrogenase family protein [Pseudomonadales bacterium]MCO4830734.1 acyl-CoA dehydrogenase family protein [Gammaproteobacteria bacterium]MDA8949608.1 acyl-CoA dehydrogenase family protein [Pseudomonadales bacterium]
MFQGMNFAPAQLPGELEALRTEVREFLNAETDWHPNSDFNAGASPEFSKRFAAKGWIGMTWPKEYGGGGRSFLERYVVTEELLAAGAPVGCHWIADRQSGPLLLKFGTEAQKQAFLPGIISGESFYSIGMSEPDTGSDLASIRTSAVQVPGGWCLNGSKIWTSNAHLNHFMVTLVRTAPATENRHEGMSQFIVPIHADGVTVRGIDNLAGEQDFNQIFFDDVFVPDDHVVGEAGNGWAQVMSELAYERSGPERFLSAFRVLAEFGKSLQNDATESQARLYGQLVAHLVVLRRMSISIASLLENGLMPDTEAALIKDLGNSYERLVPEVVRLYLPGQVPKGLAQALEECVLHAPSFTLRGGTREILRGMIARGLGLR